jgi:hypothetical protein
MSFSTPIAIGIIRDVLPEKKLAIGQTIFSSTFSGGAVVGLVFLMRTYTMIDTVDCGQNGSELNQLFME